MQSMSIEELGGIALDPEIEDLVYLINNVEGIKTTGSCCGHNKGSCWITCIADSIEILHKFMHDYFYNDELWHIEMFVYDSMFTDNNWGEVCFIIRSDPRYIDYPTINVMVVELTRRFKLHQIVGTSEYDWNLLRIT